MSDQISEDFKEDFLLRLVEEIIRNTQAYKDFRIRQTVRQAVSVKQEVEKLQEKRAEIIAMQQEVSRERAEEMKSMIGGKIKEESDKISEMQKSGLLPELKKIYEYPFIPQKIQVKSAISSRRNMPPVLNIPEPELPSTVSYIKPEPTTEMVDLGRLNILVNDPLVKVIECNGPDKNIIVMGMMGRKNTPIKLSKEEIETTLGIFSGAAKIPINEGLFKAVVGSLVISAVISEIVGIQFIIRKIAQEYTPSYQY